MAAGSCESTHVRKILVADDSATEFEHINAILTRRGYEIVRATNGAEAVQLAALRKPDMILMDVVMPDMNGYQATRILSRDEETAHIPVVIVSSKGQESDRAWGLRQGARAYLVKPVSEAMLMKAIDYVEQS